MTLAGIKDLWQQEKVIRVSDSFRGSEKLIVINQATQGASGIVIKNRLTETKFDIVVTNEIMSDVVREKYAQILIESTKRADPSAVPLIMDVAFEMLDLPRKEFILTRLRQAFNLDLPPEGDEVDKEEMAKQIMAAKQRQTELQDRAQALEFEEKELKNEKIIAQIRKLLSQASKVDKDVERSEVDTELALVKGDREEKQFKVDTGKTMHDMGMAEIDVMQKEKDRGQQLKAKKGGAIGATAKKRVANS